VKGLILLVFGFACLCAGLFLIRRAAAMSSTVERQLNSQPDSWYDFSNRVDTFAFGFALIVLGFVGGWRAFVEWFMP